MLLLTCCKTLSCLSQIWLKLLFTYILAYLLTSGKGEERMEWHIRVESKFAEPEKSIEKSWIRHWIMWRQWQLYFARCSLQTSLLGCLAITCLLCSASVQGQRSTEQQRTTVHVRVYAPASFLRDKPEVFVSENEAVKVVSGMQISGLQADKYGTKS